MTGAFLAGIVFGLAIAALVAGWIWVSLTPGSDHPLTAEEIKARIVEVLE